MRTSEDVCLNCCAKNLWEDIPYDVEKNEFRVECLECGWKAISYYSECFELSFHTIKEGKPTFCSGENMNLLDAIDEILTDKKSLKQHEITYIESLKNEISPKTAQGDYRVFDYFKALYERFKIRTQKIKSEYIPPKPTLTYWQMCSKEGGAKLINMHYRPTPDHSVFIISTKSTYDDRIDGNWIIYDGIQNQPERNSFGRYYENGQFHNFAQQYKKDLISAEKVQVYCKVPAPQSVSKVIWADLGKHTLVDSIMVEEQDKPPQFVFTLKKSK